MAKLFQINYLQDNDDGHYLTVGEDNDTEETIRDREYGRMEDTSCLYFFNASLIEEVDGRKIHVE